MAVAAFDMDMNMNKFIEFMNDIQDVIITPGIGPFADYAGKEFSELRLSHF